jgi:hypothetical protein
MSESANLLTPAAAAWIGFTTSFPAEPVIARDVLRYMVATGAPLPPDNQREQPRVPPLFYRTLGRRIASVDEIRDDGLWLGLRPTIGVGQVLAGGIDVEFHRELVVGDLASGTRRLDSLTEKSGRKRDFVLAIWIMSLTDATGAEVLRETVTEIMY